MPPPPHNSGSGGVDGKSLVLDAVDLVKLVGETVPLKKQGVRYVGCCPFHNEKTPSFGVNQAKQFFYCFGCKKGGNAIDFVIERDHCDFRTALETLSDWAGIELPQFGGQSREKTDRLGRLRDACSAAADVYRRALRSAEGKAALDYLRGRGFSDKTLDAFGVGYAPAGWHGLADAGLARKFDERTLLEAGLLKDGDRGRYDTFRNRVIFPIRDEQGRPIAFGGRVLPGDDSPAKYLNSPETPLFNKSAVLFGLDLAKSDIAKSRTAVVFEGYADAAMAYQYGVTNGVAVLGTSLTADHAKVLRRLADRVVLLFDADTAGETATRRSVELFLREPVDVAVAELPAGTDPDEFLQNEGIEAFRQRLDGAADALTYQWRRLTRSLGDHPGVTARQRAIDDYLQTLSEARSGVGGQIDDSRWVAVLRRVERLTGLSIDELRDRFDPPSRRPPPPPRREKRWRRRDEPVYSDARRADIVAETVDGVTRMGRLMLGALFREPHLWHDVQARIGPDDLTDRRQRWLAELFWDHLRNEGEPSFAEWLDVVREAALSASGGGDASASAARSACIQWYEAAAELGEASRVAADATRGLLKVRDDAGLRELLGDVRRAGDSAAASGSAGAGEEDDENQLLRRLQDRLRDLGRGPNRTGGKAS